MSSTRKAMLQRHCGESGRAGDQAGSAGDSTEAAADTKRNAYEHNHDTHTHTCARTCTTTTIPTARRTSPDPARSETDPAKPATKGANPGRGPPRLRCPTPGPAPKVAPRIHPARTGPTHHAPLNRPSAHRRAPTPEGGQPGIAGAGNNSGTRTWPSKGGGSRPRLNGNTTATLRCSLSLSPRCASHAPTTVGRQGCARSTTRRRRA